MGTQSELSASLFFTDIISLVAFLRYTLKVCTKKNTVEIADCYEKLKGGIECNWKKVKKGFSFFSTSLQKHILVKITIIEMVNVLIVY